jgi:hypothetical protein
VWPYRDVDAETTELPRIVAEMAEWRGHVDPRLREVIADPRRPPKTQLHARLALLPVDPDQAAAVCELALEADATQVPVIAQQLRPQLQRVAEVCWHVAQDSAQPGGRRIRAACLLAPLTPDDPRWQQIAQPVASQLAAEDLLMASHWTETLRPTRRWLVPPLVTIFRDRAASQSVRTLVAGILADYASDADETLAGLVELADPEQLVTLLPSARSRRDAMTAHMLDVLSWQAADDWADAARDPAWTDPPATAAQVITNAGGVLADQFACCQTMPLAQFESVARELEAAGYRPSCFRPFGTPQGVEVAAVWLRDGRRWEIVADRSPSRRPHHALSADPSGGVIGHGYRLKTGRRCKAKPPLCSGMAGGDSESNLSISSINACTISLSSTVRTISPRLKMTPLPRPAAMPRSASRASPGPLTTQPRIEILSGCLRPLSRS